jgi:WS/DGAT/MGAT family acyltransferase
VAGQHFDRLTQLDHSFLIYESPNDPMHVAATAIYDAAPLRRPEGGLDIDRIRAWVESRLHRIPRYRQRLAWAPWIEHPVWVDDARFNLGYHVRQTRLPRPGSERMLKRLAGRILSQQLDRGKPLWEMWVIEGLAGDRFAVITKTHHCMVDGVSGADLLAVLMTPEPTEKIEPPPNWVPRPAPGGARLLVSEALHRASLPFSLVQGLVRVARDENRARHDLTERARALGRLLAGGMRNASNTPLNQRVGPHRRIDWTPVPIAAIKEVRKQLGGSLNDVVLATAAGALRRFLSRNRGVDCSRLDFRAMAPVSVRAPGQRGSLGNRVAAWIVPLPLGEPDARARLDAIRATTSELKRKRHALGAETLTQLSEWTGSTLLAVGARLVTWGQPFNLVITNVPGPQVPLWLLEARMLEVHPMVPLMGNLALGIALFSYAGTLSWGLSADWDLVPDLHDLALAIGDAFDELRAAAGLPPLAPPAPAAPEPVEGLTPDEGTSDGG